ncbi:hypothetical protein JYU34_003259 [Plutella xylostella]|uniref:Protein rolling stone-like n=1 Tax=Plutella xylostella TaxID=51655 RepID=A0ABQ7QZK9_PLUXY|nr:hypothetical protein JYU34_003259 [Plutella xylostella]
MCKHVVLIPMKTVDTAMQKKSCKPAMFGRAWLATRRALSLEHPAPHQFACYQWQRGPRPPLGYVIYRWVLFLGVLCVGVSSFALQHLPPGYAGPVARVNYMKWFIYLTNWGYLVLVLQSGLALALAQRGRAERSLHLANEEDNSGMLRRRRTPLLCRVYWMSHTVATDLALVITLVYWTLVHDPKIHEVNALNLLVHGGNSVIIVVELAVTSHPVRMAHALYGAGAGLLYGVFSALYWALGGTDRLGARAIYPSLDWSRPGVAIGFVCLCAVVLVTAHALAAALAGLRARVAARLLPAPREPFALPHH